MIRADETVNYEAQQLQKSLLQEMARIKNKERSRHAGRMWMESIASTVHRLFIRMGGWIPTDLKVSIERNRGGGLHPPCLNLPERMNPVSSSMKEQRGLADAIRRHGAPASATAP
jgi:hypothetical protein